MLRDANRSARELDCLSDMSFKKRVLSGLTAVPARVTVPQFRSKPTLVNQPRTMIAIGILRFAARVGARASNSVDEEMFASRAANGNTK